MRKLMWFTIGFAAACGLCTYVLSVSAILPIMVAASIITSLLFIIAGKYHISRRAALVTLGFAVAMGWYSFFQSKYLAPSAALDGQTLTCTIRTTDYSNETDYGAVVEGRLILNNKTYRVRTYLKKHDPIEPGFELTGHFQFIMTAPEDDPASYNSSKGIFLIARQKDALTVTKAQEILWQDRISYIRYWIRSALQTSFPEDTLPFAQALLLGDTSKLDYETDSNFKVSGIRHVVAVSGLHVSILFALLGAVTFRKKFLMAPVGLFLLLLFSALAGFSPSVNRACMMSGLLLLAMLFNREYDEATALAFSVLIMLLYNPLVIGDVSFQLSVASVSGIYLFRIPIRNVLLDKLEKPLCSKLRNTMVHGFSTSVSITLSASVMTVPLCAYYFGMVSLVGIVTNLLALWLISGIFYGILAVCLLFWIWMPGAAYLAKVVSWPVRYVLWVAEIMADIPLAAIYTSSIYVILWLTFVYILLTAFLLNGKRRPGQLVCCAVLSLCIALITSWIQTEDTSMTVLDVGQGQCILLRSEDKIFMVDCGGDDDSRTADIAAGYLLSRGITKLDGLIVTHLDRDHAGAVENLLTRVDTDLLILPPVYSELGNSENVVYATENLILGIGNSKICVYTSSFPGTSNEKSLCVLFDTEKCDILITGDRDGFGERMLLRSANIPDVDVLIAGHHGSKNSTCTELLNAVSPEIVCISAGKYNSYGHPAPELLQRLSEFGCTVYRTDKHGTITIRR